MKDGDSVIKNALKEIKSKNLSLEKEEDEVSLSISSIFKTSLLQDIEERNKYAKKAFQFMKYFTFSILFIGTVEKSTLAIKYDARRKLNTGATFWL